MSVCTALSNKGNLIVGIARLWGFYFINQQVYRHFAV